MSGIAELLAALGPADPLPTVSDLGGEQAIVQDLLNLPAEAIPDLIDVVRADLDSVAGLDLLGAAMATRLSSDVVSPLSFARGADSLMRITAARPECELALGLMDALLAVASDYGDGDAGALRAGHAIRAAVDLALLDIGASVHSPLATIEHMTDIPALTAPSLSRAVGRLSEHSDAVFLTELLETELMRHADSAADALLELGLVAMRSAFAAPDAERTEVDLSRSIELFDQARCHDGNRPDARTFRAAAQGVLAFAGDPDAMSSAILDLEVAQQDLEMYSAGTPDDFRGAEPSRSPAAWLVLVSELTALRGHLDTPDRLNLEPGLRALAAAYSGARLAVLDDQRLGFTKFIQPVIRSGLEGNPGLPEALTQLAGTDDAPPQTEELATAVMRPKARSRQMCRSRLRSFRRR